MMPTPTAPAAHPASVPTLTEIIELPLPADEPAGDALLAAAVEAAPAIDVDALARQLVEQLGPQLEALVEARLRSAVAEACEAAAERARTALGVDLRACVDASLREAVAASRASPAAADQPEH